MTVSFRVKLLASHAVVALLVGGVTLVVVDRQVSDRMEHQVDQRLEAQAAAVGKWMERAGHPNQLAHRLAGVVDAEVTILDKAGTAIGDSSSDPAVLTGSAGPGADGEPAEVRAARAGGVGRETRFSSRDGAPVRYVAVPARDQTVVRLGVPVGEIDETKHELRGQLIIAAVASLLAAVGLAVLVAGPLTRRLRDATAVARRIGAGDLAVPDPSDAADEIGVLSRALAAAAAQLRETERARRAFLANVAHEIRTPVTSIRGYADLLAAGTVDAATSREFVDTIGRNATRVGRLVDELLELEALEAGRDAALAREPVALAPIASAVARTLRARAEAAGATITVAVPGDALARGDADAIERIVLNLVDNAVRYGGPGVGVTIAAARGDAGRAVLRVTDTGPGIPAAHRAQIFDRFQRGARAGQDREGTGLGLAIARQLAQAMGGTLVLDGAATFVLELPA